MSRKAKPIKWEVDPEKGCFVVTSHGVDGHGYPKVERDGRTRKWVKVLWEEENGPVEEGKLLLHNCDNRLCVNLAHIRVGTSKDNAVDRSVRKRFRPARCRATQEQVLYIRDHPELSSYKLKNELGLDHAAILRIRNGKTHKNAG